MAGHQVNQNPQHPIARVAELSNHNHRKMHGLRVRSDLATNLKPVHSQGHYIKQDDVPRLSLYMFFASGPL